MQFFSNGRNFWLPRSSMFRVYFVNGVFTIFRIRVTLLTLFLLAQQCLCPSPSINTQHWIVSKRATFHKRVIIFGPFQGFRVIRSVSFPVSAYYHKFIQMKVGQFLSVKCCVVILNFGWVKADKFHAPKFKRKIKMLTSQWKVTETYR